MKKTINLLKKIIKNEIKIIDQQIELLKQRKSKKFIELLIHFFEFKNKE